MSALKCRNVLSAISVEELQKYIPDVVEAMQVKSGSKESQVLESMSNMILQEHHISNGASASGEDPSTTDSGSDREPVDLDAAVRSKVFQTLESIAIEHGLRTAGAANNITNSTNDNPSVNEAIVPAVNPVSSITTATPTTATMATTITNDVSDEWDLLDSSELDREKSILSEIEKFRQKQAQRDKDVNEQRKLRLKESIAQLKEKQDREEREMKRKRESEEKALLLQQQEEALAKSLRNAEVQIKNTVKTVTTSSSTKGIESAEELEAKQRRKQQVLEIMSGNGSNSSSSATSASTSINTPAVTSAAAASSSLKIDMKSSKKGAGSSSAAGLFQVTDAEEETRKRRAIVPLDITEEERRQAAKYMHHNESNDVSMTATTSVGDAFTQAQRQAQALTASLSKDKTASNTSTATDEDQLKEKLKQLVDKIPTDKEKLFAYEIDWNAIDRNGIIDNTLKSWVVRKMVEYLGEEEATLTDFIMNKLLSHCKPQELLKELAVVLDEDAEQFVIKLWRMLIYSILKATLK